MSFTSDVKDELSRVQGTCPTCDKAALAAILRVLGTLTITSGTRRLEVATESPSVARALISLLAASFALDKELTVRRSTLHKTHNYLITIPDQPAFDDALREMGIIGDGGIGEVPPPSLTERSCCAGAYLRGAFLSAGYIADPRGDFHFEIAAQTEPLAAAIASLMERGGIRARWCRRHAGYIVYLKGADQIISFLAFAGAHQGALAMESARVVKSLKNDTNRRVNAELANQAKASEAACRQIERIRLLVETRGASVLPPSLAEVARLRVANPSASIAELGQLADPPLTKSAVYHRLRRIDALLD